MHVEKKSKHNLDRSPIKCQCTLLVAYPHFMPDITTKNYIIIVLVHFLI